MLSHTTLFNTILNTPIYLLSNDPFFADYYNTNRSYMLLLYFAHIMTDERCVGHAGTMYHTPILRF